MLEDQSAHMTSPQISVKITSHLLPPHVLTHVLECGVSFFCLAQHVLDGGIKCFLWTYALSCLSVFFIKYLVRLFEILDCKSRDTGHNGHKSRKQDQRKAQSLCSRHELETGTICSLGNNHSFKHRTWLHVFCISICFLHCCMFC